MTVFLFIFKATLVKRAAFEHKMAAEIPMPHVDSYAQRCSSLQVGSNQAVTLLVGSTVFVAAHCLGSCACLCPQFAQFLICCGRTALKIGYTFASYRFEVRAFSGGVYLTVGKVGDSEEAKLEGDTPTWRRKRAFILRSNHGSSWYAGKLKGGRGGSV